MFTRERLKRWTDALRANPELQTMTRLFNGPSDNPSGLCCLGMLCKVEGLEFLETGEVRFGETDNAAILKAPLATELGDCVGAFSVLEMPRLRGHDSAASANDSGVNWLEIADHFDRYYPCSDEARVVE